MKDEAKLITKKQVNITLNLNDSNDIMQFDQNYGYFFLERLYEELEISNFFKKNIKERKQFFDIDKVFQLLLYGRILNSASKKIIFETQNRYFEPFNVTLDSIYKGRPVFLRNEDRIEGHFLICFVAFLFARLLENKLGKKYSVRRIQEALKTANYRKLVSGIYSLNKQDEVYKELERAYGVSLNYMNTRIEGLRTYRKEIVHNIKI